jgi:hypothetical protein
MADFGITNRDEFTRVSSAFDRLRRIMKHCRLEISLQPFDLFDLFLCDRPTEDGASHAYADIFRRTVIFSGEVIDGTPAHAKALFNIRNLAIFYGVSYANHFSIAFAITLFMVTPSRY